MKPLIQSALTVVALLSVAACNGNVGGTVSPIEEQPHGDERAAINEYIASLGQLPVTERRRKTEVPCDGDCPPSRQDGDAFCNYKRFTETEQFDRFVAFQPNSATLWPGTVVRALDAEQGLLTPVGVRLAPVTFSVSLENISGNPVATMDQPSLSAFRSERNRILASDVTGATAAKLDFEMTEVHSATQLSLALGASVSWPGGNDIAASFDFNTSERKTRLVVNFTQAYYTIDVDTPLTPADFFAGDTEVEELVPYFGDNDPPLYIQSITYGRRVIFTVETSVSISEIEAALSATYTGAASVEVDVSAAHRSTLEESKISAFVYGGSGSDATALIDGYDGLVEYIRRGGDYSKDSPGAPIAYKLAYLDNSVGRFAFTSDYAERQCVKNRDTLRAELKQLNHLGGGDSGGEVELYGWVTVRAPAGGDRVSSCDEGGQLLAVWELQQGQWVSFDEYTAWTPPSATFASIDDVAMGPEQAICLSTQLYEYDPIGNDDDYGSDSLLLDFEHGWAGTHVLQARGAGDRAVDVHVDLSLGGD